jgi:hypothetical protein
VPEKLSVPEMEARFEEIYVDSDEWVSWWLDPTTGDVWLRELQSPERQGGGVPRFIAVTPDVHLWTHWQQVQRILVRAKELHEHEPSGIEQLRILRAEHGLSLEQAKRALVSVRHGLRQNHAWLKRAIELAAAHLARFDSLGGTPWSDRVLDGRLRADARRLLTERGLPESVGSMSLGDRYARSTEGGFVIGEDTGYPITIEIPSHGVVIDDGSRRLVNTDVLALARCLDAYLAYRGAAVQVGESDAQEPIDAFELAVARADAPALAPECYWSLVLEQLRDGLL